MGMAWLTSERTGVQFRGDARQKGNLRSRRRLAVLARCWGAAREHVGPMKRGLRVCQWMQQMQTCGTLRGAVPRKAQVLRPGSRMFAAC
jgi:hypothetical protein